jgi:hypothetical protein
MFRRLRSFLSMYWRGSKSRTSPPIWLGNGAGSKALMRRMPLRPSSKACQYVGAPRPRGVTRPSPVITTRREEEDKTHLPLELTASSA